jgi:hypothetical protein
MELEVIECAAGNVPGCTFVVQRATAHFRQQGCAQIYDSALRLESVLPLWDRDVADIRYEFGEFSKAVAPATTIDVEHAAGDSRLNGAMQRHVSLRTTLAGPGWVLTVAV